jgi:hypothetical protein
MSEPMIDYGKSPIPPARPGGLACERHPDRGIDVDADGRMTHQSGAASGHVEIMVPSLPGSPRETETLHARDFGQHVIGKIESSMKRQGYMTTGPQQDPAETLAHYVAVAQGAGLVDKTTQRRLAELAKGFEAAPEPDEFYRGTVKPFLGSLSPGRRQR